MPEGSARLTLADIAGQFERGGDYIHSTFGISPDGRFSTSVSECLGTHEARGTLALVDGLLDLRIREADHWFRQVESYVPISWGDRLYLIELSRMPSFCHDAGCYLEPRYDPKGTYYLRIGDHKKRVADWPTLPERMTALLRKQPLEGRVVESPGGGRFLVDLGSDDGLAAGMMLYTCDPSHHCLRVVDAEPGRCIAEVVGVARKGIDVGQVITCNLGFRACVVAGSEGRWEPHILLPADAQEWEEAQRDGFYRGGTLESLGYLHCRTPDRVERVQDFAMMTDQKLALLYVNPSRVRSPVRWEFSPISDEWCVRIDGPLNTDAVFQVERMGREA